MTAKTLLTGKISYLLLSCTTVLLIAYLTKPPPEQAVVQHRRVACNLQYVIDGDTVVANCPADTGSKIIRLAHIDAPELRQQPWGENSRNALQQLLGKGFVAVFDGRDVYNRHLASLYLDSGESVAVALLAQGQARIYRRYRPPLPYLEAMQAAKSQRRGIWQQEGWQQNPQRWRRLMQD